MRFGVEGRRFLAFRVNPSLAICEKLVVSRVTDAPRSQARQSQLGSKMDSLRIHRKLLVYKKDEAPFLHVPT